METAIIRENKTLSKSGVWTGRVLNGLVILFLLFDAVGKIVKEIHSVQGTQQMGFPESFVRPLGLVLLIITILYLIPRTALAGGILLTAYLGGAVAIMIEHGVSIVFPIVFCILAWAGLYFRNATLRGILQRK